MHQNNRNLSIQEKKALIKNKKLPNEGFVVVPKFLFALLIGLPIFIVVIVPIVGLYILCKKLCKSKKPRSQARVLDENIEVAQDRVNPSQRQFDIVLFGATGFTGKLCAEYLAKNYQTLKWAIAGRSHQKLERVRSELSVYNPDLMNLPILIADSSNSNQLKVVVNQTKTIISTVGPFAKYGTNLVSLCAKYGTHYTDITGELAWVRQMIEQYDYVAAQSGARIISCCGFDSIPWDLLTLKISQKINNEYNQELKKIEYFDFINGNWSGGTFATLQHSFSNPPPKSLLGFDPLLKKVGNNDKSDWQQKSKNQKFLGLNKTIKKWAGMWGLADGNAGIVKRSNSLLQYGKSVFYTECLIYPSFFAGFVTQMEFMFIGALLACPPLLKLVESCVFPAPGEGPTKEQMERGYCIIKGVGTGVNGAKVNGEIMFPDDPGYRDTARMVVETGLALSLNQEQIKVGGGFWTPASCLGDILIKRLVDTGSYLTIE